jgi:hypothetical protein
MCKISSDNILINIMNSSIWLPYVQHGYELKCVTDDHSTDDDDCSHPLPATGFFFLFICSLFYDAFSVTNTI